MEKSIKPEHNEPIQVSPEHNEPIQVSPEHNEPIQAADYDKNGDGPPRCFTHPYCQIPEGTSDSNINETIIVSKKSNKENARRYRLKKKDEREVLKRKRSDLENECQSLAAENVHLKGYIKQTNMNIHELIEYENHLQAQNYEMEETLTGVRLLVQSPSFSSSLSTPRWY